MTPLAAPVIRLRVPDDAGGLRLDRFLAELAQDADEIGLPKLSRARLQRLIAQGHVLVENAPSKSALRLRGGEVLEITLPPPEPLHLVPEAMALVILHEDEDVIAVNKPAGLVVHPGAGHARGTLVHGLLAHCRDLSGIGGALRPGIVHRLDRGTSGVMVIAKSDRAHLGLVEQFAGRLVHKDYVAFVFGAPGKGRLDTPFGRHATDRKRFTGRLTSGRRAITDYATEHTAGGAARVAVSLHTGRTHQIRVHLSELGHPVLGDALYGGTRWTRLPAGPVRTAAMPLTHQALHAARLVFTHPVSGERLELRAPLPDDLLALEQAMRGLAQR